jgi:hypothetical protein
MQKIIRKTTILLIAIILLGITLSACSGSEPELDIDAQKTGFAQTANVQASQTVRGSTLGDRNADPITDIYTHGDGTSTPILTPTESNGAGTTPQHGYRRSRLAGQRSAGQHQVRPRRSLHRHLDDREHRNIHLDNQLLYSVCHRRADGCS